MDENTSNNSTQSVPGMVETKKVGMMVVGESMGKKLVAPANVTFNDDSRRFNIHLNDTDIISVSSDNLAKWANVEIGHTPGGTVQDAVSVEKNSTLQMKYSGANEDKRFFRATAYKFNRNKDTLEVILPDNHRIDIGQSRFKSMGMKLTPDFKSKGIER